LGTLNVIICWDVDYLLSPTICDKVGCGERQASSRYTDAKAVQSQLPHLRGW